VRADVRPPALLALAPLAVVRAAASTAAARPLARGASRSRGVSTPPPLAAAAAARGTRWCRRGRDTLLTRHGGSRCRGLPASRCSICHAVPHVSASRGRRICPDFGHSAPNAGPVLGFDSEQRLQSCPGASVRRGCLLRRWAMRAHRLEPRRPGGTVCQLERELNSGGGVLACLTARWRTITSTMMSSRPSSSASWRRWAKSR